MKRFWVGFLLVLMFVVPASAAEVTAKDVLYDTASVNQWNAYFSDTVFGDLTSSVKWAMLNDPVSAAGVGALPSMNSLESAKSSFRYKHKKVINNPVYAVIKILIDGETIVPEVSFDESLSVYRLKDKRSGLWIVSDSGSFPYYKPVTTDPDTGEEVEDSTLGGKWVRIDQVADYKNVVSEATLNDIAVALIGAGEDLKFSSVQDKWRGIQSTTRFENGIPFVYCDSQSRQYVNQLDPDEFAVNNDNNYYTNSDDDIYNTGPTENNQLIDVDNNTVWFPDGTMQYIENLLYDESTKTYYVDAHQEYDIDNNTYITNNYHYEYHINYTSVTYIGQTEEYNEKYEYYYELPDGRNSADLTADELLALNTSIDVVPYIRSTDTTSLRSLYHFDANTRDSSYWSYATDFVWTEGASLTYMDAGAFNGALYLDETAHGFTIQLPSAIGISDFTLQFRFYHSYTAAPVTDAYITSGDVTLASFNGAAWSLPSGGSVACGPGTWSEVALIRHDGTLYLYLNGLMAASEASKGNVSSSISFAFGDEQQTYKYFDELRILDFALAEDGSSYTPTSVPHDTNLALVLPDSTVPVADEYWSFNSEGNLLPIYDLTQYFDVNTFLFSLKNTMSTEDFLCGNDDGWYRRKVNSSGSFYVNAGYSDGAWRLTSSTSFTPPSYSSTQTYLDPYGIHFNLGSGYDGGNWNSPIGVSCGKQYTFSVMTREGEYYSVEFKLPSASNPSRYYKYIDLPDGSRIAATAYDRNDQYVAFLSIYPPSNGSLDLVYLELVEGEANTGHEFVTAVAPVNSDFKTPTLAVRTDLEITSYQIGGVRPSLPTKGLVWALVEDSRITSLQIYNGQAWEEVDGRIWTGSRWVPYYAYDVLLLKDMYDIVEADPSLNPIYTETGFWKWLQGAWEEMMKKLDEIAAGSGGSGSGSGETKSFWNRIADAFTSGLTTLIEGVFSLITEILRTLLSLVTDMLSFFFGFIGETVLGGISDFFSVFTDGSLLDGFQQTDESGNTTTQLPEGVGAVFADFSGMISALPAELLGVLVVGIALLFLLGVIMLIV